MNKKEKSSVILLTHDLNVYIISGLSEVQKLHSQDDGDEDDNDIVT